MAWIAAVSCMVTFVLQDNSLKFFYVAFCPYDITLDPAATKKRSFSKKRMSLVTDTFQIPVSFPSLILFTKKSSFVMGGDRQQRV